MSTDQPTDRPTNRQGEYRAICFFRKLENRKKAEICNCLRFIFNIKQRFYGKCIIPHENNITSLKQRLVVLIQFEVGAIF